MKLLQQAIDRMLDTEPIEPRMIRLAPDAPPDQLKELAALVEPFMRSMPDALRKAELATKDPGSGRAIALAFGQVLTYVFDDQDLLPDNEYGSLGLLDDAFFAHTFVAALLRRYPQLADILEYRTPDRRTLRVVSALMPDGVAAAIERTCESLVQVSDALLGGRSTERGAVEGYRPTLQVGKAIRAMEPVPV